MSAVLDEILEKRSALVARKRELKTELTRLAADISAIDRVVLILAPGHEARVLPVRRQRQSGFRPAPEAALTSWRGTDQAAFRAGRLTARGRPPRLLEPLVSSLLVHGCDGRQGEAVGLGRKQEVLAALPVFPTSGPP